MCQALTLNVNTTIMSCIAVIIPSHKVKSSQAYAKDNPQLTTMEFIRILTGCSLRSVLKRKNHTCTLFPSIWYQLLSPHSSFGFSCMSWRILPSAPHLFLSNQIFTIRGKRILTFKERLPSGLYFNGKEVDQDLLDKPQQGFLFWFPTDTSGPGHLAVTHWPPAMCWVLWEARCVTQLIPILILTSF